MKDEAEDQPVLNVIQQLAEEEHRLYEHETLTDADRARLTKINIELDQCWDLLRQRQALRDAGRNPDEAHVRPPEIVENFRPSASSWTAPSFVSIRRRRLRNLERQRSIERIGHVLGKPNLQCARSRRGHFSRDSKVPTP
jgi:hypothetical protein